MVSLTSASLLFTPSKDERTRIVPYCHTLSVLLNCYNSSPIATVDSESHLTSKIIRSFLADTGDWRTIGTRPSQDFYLANLGGVYFAFKDALDNFITDVDEVRYTTADGTFTLAKGPSAILFSEWMRNQPVQFQILSRGLRYTASYTATAGAFTPFFVKPAPIVFRVQPAAGPASNTINIAPGSLVSIFGTGLASFTQQATSLPLPTQLADAVVTINDQRIGLHYAGPTQINAYIPPSVSGLVRLKVMNSTGQHSLSVVLVPVVPAIFTRDGTGKGTAAALNALTGAVVGEENPLRVWDFVSLYATGLGQTYRSGGLDWVSVTPVVGIYPTEAKVLFAGLAPGYVGLYQINVQIPDGVQRGLAVPVVLKSGKYYSNIGTLPIQ